MIKSRGGVPGLSIEMVAPFGAKAATFATEESLATSFSAYCRRSNRSLISLIAFDLTQTLRIVHIICFLQLLRHIVAFIWNFSTWVAHETLTKGTRSTWDLKMWFAANFSLRSAACLRNVVVPVVDTLLYVLRGKLTPFKIGLETDTSNESDFVSIRQTLVTVAAE
jgi:hypothetical protein